MDDKELLSLITEVDRLISEEVTSSDYEFEKWKANTERFLLKKYGKDSEEYKKINNTTFSPMAYVSSMDHSIFVMSCKHGLLHMKAYLESYLNDYEKTEEIGNASCDNTDIDFSKVFIVHGHDGELKQAVARMIEKQDLSAIILSEKPNSGATIIEKIGKYSDVSCAVCLFTKDDLGKAKGDSEESYRARQNVVFEAGYFIGKLGREKVVIIVEDGVELPGDLSGVVYTSKNNWEVDVLKELKEIGYDIDFNKML